MWSFLKNNRFINGNEVLGIHLQLIDSEKFFTGILLENSKGKVNIKQKFPQNTVLDLPEKPGYLSIDGKGILHIEKLQNEETIQALNRFLPNAKPKDFYIQEVKFEEKEWISIIRIELLDEILNSLFDIKQDIIYFCLGAFPLASYNLVLEDKIEDIEVTVYNKRWEFNMGNLARITNSENPATESKIKIDSESELETNFLLPFINAINFFLNDTLNENSISSRNRKLKNEFLQKRIFKLASFCSILILFSVLLVNFLLFDYFSKSTNELEFHLNQKQVQLDEILTLETELNQKENFVQISGLDKPNKFSFSIDQIASEVPEEITLHKIAVNPLQKREVKNGEIPKFDAKMIVIEGSVIKSSQLNFWIESLQQYPWIEEIKIEAFKFTEKVNSNQFSLTIKTL